MGSGLGLAKRAWLARPSQLLKNPNTSRVWRESRDTTVSNVCRKTRTGTTTGVSQYEQENDFGRGGGEVDEETMRDAWKRSEERVGAPVDPDTGMTPLDDEDPQEDEEAT